MTPFDHEAYWRSTWRSPSIRMMRSLDRPRIAARVEIVVRRFGAPIEHDVFGHRFLLCAPALPDVSGDETMCAVLGDANNDLLVVCERERGATKAVAIHELFPTALADYLSRATGRGQDRDALARWIVGSDDNPPWG